MRGVVVRGITLALVLGLGAPGARVVKAQAVAAQGDADESVDQSWKGHVRTLLVEEKFGELDRMAEEFRRGHTRYRGGNWRLHELYEALDAPRLSDKDTMDHLAHLQKWVVQRPESMTARLALATSLHRWAWVARGNGIANTVSKADWQRFNERHHESLAILEGMEKAGPVNDPQFYQEMMAVGYADGWDKAKMRSLMERGLAIEPEYFYLERSFVNYLLPKWFGELGDSARFAKEAADRLGGERGDQAYYLIAGTMLRRGDGDFPTKQLDWARIQRGYLSVSATFGETGHMRNELAFFAYKFRDTRVAVAQFDRIGDHWATSVWRDKAFYDKARDWAHGVTS